MIRILFLFFVLISSFNSFYAKELPFNLKANEHNKNITSELYVWEKIKTDEIPPPINSSTGWKKIGSNALNFNFSKRSYWLKFRIRFREEIRENLYFVLKWKAHDLAELYTPNEVTPIQKVGDTLSKSNWPVKNVLYPTLLLQGEPGEEKEYIVKLSSESIMSFPIDIMDEAGLRANLAIETGLFSLSACLYGLLIFVALLYYRATGYKEFLLYTCYAFCMGASYDVNYGNAIELFWEETPLWSEKVNYFFFNLGGLFGFQFIRKFLDTKVFLPWVDKILLCFEIILGITLPLIFTMETIAYLTLTNEIIYSISIPMILLSGIYLKGRGNKKLNLFLLSWSLYLTLGYISIFYYMGILEYGFFTVYSVPLFFPADLLILLYNIIQKYSQNIEEKNSLLETLKGFLNKPRYVRSKISGLDVDESLSALENLMNTEKLFVEEEVSIQIVSAKIGLSTHQLSELLNSRLGMGFAAYLNSKRIEEAKTLLKNDQEDNILNIAFAVGFGSKTSFNVEFKKATGLTPKQYKSYAQKVLLQ
ncbi:7TM diverse intracellular signaling domain-containing protein [Leptospira sarikeiensis]|uniref:Helix-turn-helix domain-containing protein n=1 Tax=Leptospira sarikeiensis TaxID=2484943 RepID=A0A4R9KCD6_9LEPT|nr:7TM diverse intracellular signaling domain-containing protein [Leptospira sarikeiensis]TGL62781.1 helix-turn-helix domain-containing protein [Leptospira sarikeiensis]